jgi:hypothetical protein
MEVETQVLIAERLSYARPEPARQIRFRPPNWEEC